MQWSFSLAGGWRRYIMQENPLLFLVPGTSGEHSGASSLVSSSLDALEASAGSYNCKAGNAAFLHQVPEIAY